MQPVSEIDIDNYLDRARIGKKRSNTDPIEYGSNPRQYHSPDADVQYTKHPTTQLSQEMVNRLRLQLDAIFSAKMRFSTFEISTFCFFCQQMLEMSWNEWKKHFLNHTAEEEFFYCAGCESQVISEKSVHCMGHAILSTVFPNENVQAYMCNMCDYIKLNSCRVVKHIKDDHSKSQREAENYIDKVILIPNMEITTEPIQYKYQCVDVQNRFDCGILGCKWAGRRKDQFESHFMCVHQHSRTFLCPHCKEIIQKNNASNFLNDILYHLNLHSSHLCQCSICDEKMLGEYRILEHLVDHHRDHDNWKFRRDVRDERKPAILQEFIIMFECVICAMIFNSHADATNHFLLSHKSCHAIFKIIPLMKLMNDVDVIKWSLSIDWNKILQTNFKCEWCNTSMTKCSLIQHHVRTHQFKEFSIAFDCSFTHKSLLRSDLAEISSFDQYLIYYCGHCVDSAYENAEEVYKHWRITHKRGEHMKPFRFRVAPLAKCQFCDTCSTFQGLKKHHAEQHSINHFIIENLLDRSKCGLCFADCSDGFTKHFENNHRLVLETNVLDPIVLPDDLLKKLRNLSLHKKRKCKHCDDIFESSDEFYKHHDHQHRSHKERSERFHDNESIHLICSCCNEKLKQDELIQHLTERKIALLEKFYWDAKVVFGNGLVVNKHNLLGTKLDESHTLNTLIEKM